MASQSTGRMVRYGSGPEPGRTSSEECFGKMCRPGPASMAQAVVFEETIPNRAFRRNCTHGISHSDPLARIRCRSCALATPADHAKRRAELFSQLPLIEAPRGESMG